MTTTAQTEDALLAALDTIRTHWPALLVTSICGSSGPSGSDDVTSLDRRISLRHEVTLTLNGWARVIVEERDLTHGLPLGHDTLGLVTLLERWARWFSGHEAVHDCVAELTEAAREVRSTAAPKRREWVYLGDCPFVIGDWFCSGQVRAWPDGDRMPSCSDCGQEAVVEWWEEVLDVGPLTWEQMPAFVSRTTGRTPTRRTLERWLSAGVIVSCGMDGKGRRLFDRAAVAASLDTRKGDRWTAMGRIA